jgi:hypothetical protein
MEVAKDHFELEHYVPIVQTGMAGVDHHCSDLIAV